MSNYEQARLPFDDASPAPEPRPAPPHASRVPHSMPVRTLPFSYTAAMQEVVDDLVDTLPELRHIDTTRVLLSISQARQRSTHGVYATCVPLRFEGGSAETRVGKHRYRMPPLVWEGRDILYVLYFMLPRFHEEQDYREKLATVIHELYHISPSFDGDIRRFPGKNWAHGTSRERYHEAMRVLADRYLENGSRSGEHHFLRTSFEELLRRPGGVVGFSIGRPRARLMAEARGG